MELKYTTLEEYQKIWRKSIERPDEFWGEIASELFWFKKWDKVLEYKSPSEYRWFVGGKINISFNSVDRWLNSKANQVALIWENELGDAKKLTYQDLHREVNRISKSLKDLGVKKGDRVMLYMPMVPEAMEVMLASARIGAIHSVVFSGFGKRALIDRIESAKPKVIFTADVTYRRGKSIELKSTLDEALKETNVDKVIVLDREGKSNYKEERDETYSEFISKGYPNVKPEPIDSSDPLFILYTSGTTGKPKGVVHAMGSYTVWAYFHNKWLFDFNNTVFLSTSDIGWINGHSYSTYGPLLNGGTVVWFEGVPTKIWELVEKYRVNYIWTAPTLVRQLMKENITPDDYGISSLKIIVTAGEILGGDAFDWLNKFATTFETWGQTENSGFIASPGGMLIGLLKVKKGSVGLPLPSISIDVVDDEGHSLPPGKAGHIIVKSPSPAFMVGLWNDDRYIKYYERFGYYYTGDYGYKDSEGYLYILGRADDVIKIAGHRVGVGEIEEASHIEEVAEVAVVGVPDEVKGSRVVIFAVPKDGVTDYEGIKRKITEKVHRELGKLVDIKEVIVVNKLPHTRTGKIMRRVLRALATNGEIGDMSTLEDESSIEEVKKALSEIRKL